ncbi:hypothetical protein DUNSADRAFT_7321 [Dunaliella salina]|uniref:Uncharacterized protein n=1 Tax=Dunaliella salina TaxID=3046 RepID=A0ABQ7GLI6_DUNSA|nr:hypothetical protein DUNSADRAFT_7321 [Dunaliella salina]|eukprot:KAF5835481.1 hypothetical protein DUNSADRAFT_7321 [Dunaliella salina]
MSRVSRASRLLAGLSGASAVGAGAYGAHKFKPKDEHYSVVYQRANQYHLIHSFLLGMAPLARYPLPVASLATLGIGGFCGSCYAVALTEDRSWSIGAPFGGMALIAAWLALAL